LFAGGEHVEGGYTRERERGPEGPADADAERTSAAGRDEFDGARGEDRDPGRGGEGEVSTLVCDFWCYFVIVYSRDSYKS